MEDNERELENDEDGWTKTTMEEKLREWERGTSSSPLPVFSGSGVSEIVSADIVASFLTISLPKKNFIHYKAFNMIFWRKLLETCVQQILLQILGSSNSPDEKLSPHASSRADLNSQQEVTSTVNTENNGKIWCEISGLIWSRARYGQMLLKTDLVWQDTDRGEADMSVLWNHLDSIQTTLFFIEYNCILSGRFLLM